MHVALRATLTLGLYVMGSLHLAAGTIPLFSDISVSLTAEPHNNLQSGQRVALTIAVTNNGPGAAAPVMVGSSPIYDELDVNTATSDCGDTLGLAVVDLDNGYYYQYSWFPTIDSVPLAVGETRYCHLNLDFTEAAPDAFSLTFSMPYWLVDLDPSNNSATVTLRRASGGGATATPVPTLSPLGLAALAGSMALLACLRRRGMRRGHAGLPGAARVATCVDGMRCTVRSPGTARTDRRSTFRSGTSP